MKNANSLRLKQNSIKITCDYISKMSNTDIATYKDNKVQSTFIVSMYFANPNESFTGVVCMTLLSLNSKSNFMRMTMLTQSS